MNLFLHGIKDFEIINDDTLKSPAFLENNQLKKFDICLANPPYSIKQWDRSAFESDRYGRNFLGTPPQGRADYAFIQHILKSLKDDTGRCAVLLPHGILFRDEEKTIREELIKSDLIDCVIGLAANLFYNSPMEACILICKKNKEVPKRGQILFINAVNEATRKNAESYLEDGHISKIANAYNAYKDDEHFAKVVTIEDVKKNNFSLSIPLYVKPEEITTVPDDKTLNECFTDWKEASVKMNDCLKELQTLI